MNSPKATEATEPQTSTTIQIPESEAPATDRLSFLESDEVYFDINLSSGVFDDLKISIGDQELTESGKLKSDGTNKPVVEGTGNGTDIYVVMYSGGTATEVVIATGDLQRTFDIYFKSLAGEKLTFIFQIRLMGTILHWIRPLRNT